MQATQPKAQSNKKQRSGIMLAHPYEPRHLIPGVLILQPKLNGVRCVGKLTRKYGSTSSVQLFSSTATEIPYETCREVYLDLYTLLLAQPEETFPQGSTLWLDGELYNHDFPFETISGLARRRSSFEVEKTHILQYHVFDIQDPLKPDWDRQNRLDSLFFHLSLDSDAPKNLFRVPYQTLSYHQPFDEALAQIDQELAKFLALGYEGLIIRQALAKYEYKRSRHLLKIKPDSYDYYEITGFEEAISIHGEPLGRIGAFVVKDRENRRFKVGSGRLTHYTGFELWKQRQYLRGKWVKVAYLMHSTKNHVPTSGRAVEVFDSEPEASRKEPSE